MVLMSAQAGELRGIRLSAGPEGTRVVLDLSGATEHRLFELSGPNRIVVDLTDTLRADRVAIPSARGQVAGVRTGPLGGDGLRVVLDLNDQVQSKSFLLAPEGRFGHRLVIDLEPGIGSNSAPRTAAAPVRGRDLVIAIDAGHGGKDPGASGPRGAREKDVVLAIANRLAERVDQQVGMRAVLIRNGDYFVTLGRRVEIAREARADLFISIHADAFRNASAQGATVYALSTRRASDEVARRSAERENASDSIGGIPISQLDDTLAHVLLDLSQSAAISASMVAGERLIDEMSHVTRMRKSEVQQGSFLVLTAPDIPSIFVEAAYISNPREEALLRDAGYQGELAGALFRGIVQYFRSHAPSESLFAQNPPPVKRDTIRHVIARGETLSLIAERYRISLRSLRQTNRLNSDVIRIGQVLTIPSTG
jgi:N-acetylmuramoyl-L-alanine amidase